MTIQRRILNFCLIMGGLAAFIMCGGVPPVSLQVPDAGIDAGVDSGLDAGLDAGCRRHHDDGGDDDGEH